MQWLITEISALTIIFVLQYVLITGQWMAKARLFSQEISVLERINSDYISLAAEKGLTTYTRKLRARFTAGRKNYLVLACLK